MLVSQICELVLISVETFSPVVFNFILRNYCHSKGVFPCFSIRFLFHDPNVATSALVTKIFKSQYIRKSLLYPRLFQNATKVKISFVNTITCYQQTGTINISMFIYLSWGCGFAANINNILLRSFQPSKSVIVCGEYFCWKCIYVHRFQAIFCYMEYALVQHAVLGKNLDAKKRSHRKTSLIKTNEISVTFGILFFFLQTPFFIRLIW